MVHSSTITDTPRLAHIDSHIKYNASKLKANRNDVHLDNYLNSFKYVHYFSNYCIHDIIDFYKTVMSHAVWALRYFIKEALILPMIQDPSTSVQLSDNYLVGHRNHRRHENCLDVAHRKEALYYSFIYNAFISKHRQIHAQRNVLTYHLSVLIDNTLKYNSNYIHFYDTVSSFRVCIIVIKAPSTSALLGYR